LTVDHEKTTTTLYVADATNWEKDDILVLEVPRLALNGGSVLSNDIRTITNVNGNTITINSSLTENLSAGMYVGNMSSNITIRPGYSIVGGSTNCNATGLVLHINGNSSFYEIKNCSFINFGGTASGGAIINFKNFAYSRSNPVIENIAVYCNNSTTNVAFQKQYGNNSYFTDIRNVAYYAGTSNNSDFTFLRTNANIDLKDSVIYKSGRISSITGTILSCRISNIRAFTTQRAFGDNAVLNNLSVYNSFIRNNPTAATTSFITVANAYNLALFENCNIHSQSNVSGGGTNAYTGNAEGATGNLIFKNCSLSGINTEANNNLPSDKLYAVNVTYKNQNKLLNYRFNTFYTLSANYSIRNRGIASYESKATKPNSGGVFSTYPYLYYEKIPAKADIPQRYIGYIKYDSTYANNSNNLPYITFTDELNTSSVTQTFSCSPTPNVWQKFDLTITPAVDGDVTMTFNGQTNALVGKAFLDGLTFDPICPNARHYGFVFDAFPYRTENTLTTLTENQVSAISTVNNLDYLYDASNYWSVTNPSLTAYTDLYTEDGNILDFGSKNIIIDNSASTGFAYASASSTLTLKTPLLSSGSNFIGLRTTGNIYLSSGSTIGEIDIYGNVFQATPVSLSGIYMEGILAYNTDSNTTIEYTDCAMDTVQNDGTGIITIKKTNSTITNGSDAQIVDFIPTILNVTLNGGYLAIYDNTGTRPYYQNTDGTIVLPSNATGTWTYKIAKYGYQYIQNSFVVDPNTGATIEINPSYTPDNFVTSNIATVSSYGDLNSSEKIYNYLNYWTTTSSGIDYVPFYSKAFGSITINKNVVLDATAVSVLSYDGSSILTLKCSGLDEDILFASNSSITNVNGTTYSDDVKIRATNLNSELILGGITSFTLYPTLSDRNNNTSIGPVLTGTIDRFLYGSVSTGVTLSGGMYARVVASSTTLLYENTFSLGRNELEFGTTGTLQQIISNQKIINQGIQKASILVPHTTNI
jgi:hypothetical protein